jgi:hypothetical protein
MLVGFEFTLINDQWYQGIRERIKIRIDLLNLLQKSVDAGGRFNNLYALKFLDPRIWVVLATKVDKNDKSRFFGL